MGKLPGQEMVETGLADAQNGVVSASSLLVWMASERLTLLGHSVAERPALLTEGPELALYALLCETVPAPYSRYNALRRELTAYLRAASHGT